MRYFIQLSYDGTNYHGWQSQKNSHTIQDELEKSISVLCKKTIQITGAGRTDTGVHASYYIAHFDVPNPIDNITDFCFHLNCILPHDIAVHNCFPVSPNTHARFDASSRTYEYHISRKKSPFRQRYHAMYTEPLDIHAMNKACAVLFEYRDFTSFSKKGSDVKTHLCTIQQAYWKDNGETWVFTIKADRFLRNMVRAIVGTMLDIGRGKLNEDDFRAIIESKNRSKSGASANAKGLILNSIEYPSFA